MRRALSYLSLILLLLCGCERPGKHLYIFSWEGFFDPDKLHEFEQENHCRVLIDPFANNEAMFAKLRSGADGYDIAVPSDYFVGILVKHDMIDRLKVDELSNYHLIDFDNPLFQTAVDREYSVPYFASFTTLAYRKDRITNPVPSWGMLGDSKLKGRVTLLDDMRETMGAALKFLGYSANTTNPDQIWEAARQVVRWKQNIAKFELEQYKNGIATAEFLLVHGFAAELTQAIYEDDQIELLPPQEGVITSCDHLVVMKNSRNKELAHRFIDFMCRPDVSAVNGTLVASISPIRGAVELMDEEIRSLPAITPPAELLRTCEMLSDLGEAQHLYLDAWQWARSADPDKP